VGTSLSPVASPSVSMKESGESVETKTQKKKKKKNFDLKIPHFNTTGDGTTEEDPGQIDQQESKEGKGIFTC
jgi:hypothetical protein